MSRGIRNPLGIVVGDHPPGLAIVIGPMHSKSFWPDGEMSLILRQIHPMGR